MTSREFGEWFRGGQFDQLSDDEIAVYLTRAAVYVDSSWGKHEAEGIANCAAHMIIVDQAEGSQPIDQIDADDAIEDRIGPISSRRSEKLVEMMATDTWRRTAPGRRYAEIRDLIGLGGSCG